LKRIANKLTYVVEVPNEYESVTKKKLLLKFTRQYGLETHQYCSDNGIAPKLFGCQDISGGWTMVIMEYLDGYPRLCDLDSQMKKKVKMSVMETVQIMHSGNYVHGDLRSVNIMISEGDVKLLDFDWSGKEGMIRYPHFINRISIKVWHSEVHAGALIRKTHDLHLLDHIFKDE